MTNIHIIGKPRSGKGILMTMLATDQGDQGTIVNSNYHIDGINQNFIGFYDFISFLKKPRQEIDNMNNIDELPGWCDSYVTSSKSSRFATHMLNQSQKLNYDIIFSSQRSMRADINFRELRDFACVAEKVCICGAKKCPSDCENIDRCYFKYSILDPDQTDEDVLTGKNIKIPFEFAATFWNRYRTFEAVPPIGLDDILVEMQKAEPNRMKAEVNRQVEVIRQVWKPAYILDLRTIRDLLNENDEHLIFADLVFSRFRRTRFPPKQTPETPNLPPQNNNQQYSSRGWLQPHRVTE